MPPARGLLRPLLAASLIVPAAASAQDLIVYVSPDPIGVNAFLGLGQVGTEAAAEAIGAEAATYESASAAARAENVQAALNEGASIVVLLGFEFNDLVAQLAPTAPDTQFLIVDQCIDPRPANVSCAVFREYEATYLIGLAAGLLTESGRVGVVGALDIPFLHRYTDAYAQGARAANPEVEVDVRWVGGENPFADPVRAKEQAVALRGAGADVIFTATSGGDFGVFESAREEGFYTMAVDVNHCAEVPGRMVDVALKRVDTAIVQAVEAIHGGETGFLLSLGLAEGGMSTIALEPDMIAQSGCVVAEDAEVAAAMQAAAQSIIDGTLVLEDPMLAQ